MTSDKEKWLDGVVNEMEEDMKRHRQTDFYKKMRRLNARQVKMENCYRLMKRRWLNGRGTLLVYLMWNML